MLISIIAAVADNSGIGLDGRIPWRLKADLIRFRELTSGHFVIMGRKTYESLPAAGLPGRKIIVITLKNLSGPGVLVANSLKPAIEFARMKGETEVFICGGANVYREALPLADKLYITHVHTKQLRCDTFFPEWDRRQWRIADSMRQEVGPDNLFPSTFRKYVRKLPGEDD